MSQPLVLFLVVSPDAFSASTLLVAGLATGWVCLLLLTPLVWRRRPAGARSGWRWGVAHLAGWLETRFGAARLAYWQVQVERAGLPLRPGELYLLAGALGGSAAVSFATLSGYALLASFGGVLLGATPFLLVLRRANRREREGIRLVENACTMLAAAAKTGAPPERLLELLARTEAPLGPIFALVVKQARTVGAAAALFAVRARPHPAHLDGLLSAFLLQADIGGPIASLLTAAARDLQARLRANDRLRVRLEGIRYQYWLLCGIVFVVLVALRLEEGRGVDAFLRAWPGQVYELMLWGIALLVGVWLHRLTRLPGVSEFAAGKEEGEPA